MDEIELRDIGIGDAGWLIQAHAEHYATEEGFDWTFEPLVAEILVTFLRHRDPSCERAWIAWRGGHRLGSIFCVNGPKPGQAKLRLFLLTPESRGVGLGKRMLATCIAHARDRGYRELVLWTHASHQAACALYEKAGFDCIDSRPVTSFGQPLIEQTWKLKLR
ncbi:GNAT family N-acetyltransferase [Nioella nitratireducens]|uniref:GNAT family N-acetyltransferase n=1 Tax=Nioella nitratireducens TaxID=1287720 RepID=UPI0008FCFE15|nr:GNAT family N-acetyltransferase [Nioella nitratireducens]